MSESDSETSQADAAGIDDEQLPEDLQPGEDNPLAEAPDEEELPDDLDARLRHEAERRGVTVSELTREAIETLLTAPRGTRRLHAAGAGASGRADISERIEEILASEVRPSR